jgi:hypothetical protein
VAWLKETVGGPHFHGQMEYWSDKSGVKTSEKYPWEKKVEEK